GRSTIWAAWFDAEASPRTQVAKRFASLDETHTTEVDAPATEPLIRIADTHLSRDGAAGSVPGLAWDVRWSGGRPATGELPAWLPAPMHARSIAHDATCEGTITVGETTRELRGRVLAMHQWG